MDFRERKVLVTGGAGFIGSHLAERLLDEGAQVRVLDDFSTGRRENVAVLEDRIELMEASVVDAGACAAACEGMDFVLHQAAIPSVSRSVDDPRRTHAAAATGSLNMVLAARDAGVRRFVYAGSSSAYGDTPTLPKHEEMRSHPRSPYAIAKLAGEQYAEVAARLFGLETVILRYFNVFGPRQDATSTYSAVIPLFITQALDGVAPTIDGDGSQTRDFTYIENVVQANFRACFATGPEVVGHVFNVGGGERISIRSLWERIREITGAEVEATFGPRRAGDVRDSLADLARIRAHLDYEVRVPLTEGLRRTADWLESHRAAD